jgi:hypothetical protein
MRKRLLRLLTMIVVSAFLVALAPSAGASSQLCGRLRMIDPLNDMTLCVPTSLSR